jgi:hypothetical protein
MATLQNQAAKIDSLKMQRLAPALARTAAETAGAFLCAETSVPLAGTPVPRFSDFGAMRCSQKNVGDRHEMICNLAVDKDGWNRLFKGGEPEEIQRDAFCELANCICGAVLANAEFADEFGYLIPCVPCTGSALVPANASRMKGAFKMGGAWIRYSFTVMQAAGAAALAATNRVSAAVA